MNTATLLVQCLEAEGVEVVFGIPGEENLELINALSDSAIRLITTRHEQGAAFMADVFGRLTGRAGVCLATLGPGATNLITGVADANSDGAPMVAITGQVSTERMHITSHQYLDLSKIFEPVTKRTKMIVQPDTVCEVVRLAFKYAQSGKMGATHIDLPVNVAGMEVPAIERPIKPKLPMAEYADRESVELAAAMMTRAKCPVMLVGAEAVRNGVDTAVRAFAHKQRIPVVNTMMAKGVLPCDDPYAMWTVGIPQRDYQDLLLDRADLLLCVGYDIVELNPERLNPRRDKQIIHINRAAAHINKFYGTDVEVVGDVADSLNRIAALGSRSEDPAYAFALRTRMTAEHAVYETDESYPPKPQRILHDVRKAMRAGDLLLSDVGAHKMWIARHYNCYEANSCIISNGFATMGIAVPGALAARYVAPDKRVLAITGDGGFMMNSQELETALREKLPFVTLIFNDGGYGLISWKQIDRFGHPSHTGFGNPDFAALAESMGCKGYRVRAAGELPGILEYAFAQSVPAVIDCPVDYSENARLTSRLAALKP
ncbi:MAG TPA: acetolactate synthase large subunit [Candidatus Limiplasma sp.]|nr:acetolactate synthase large subunit [Candidatus Limiplasma sp.]